MPTIQRIFRDVISFREFAKCKTTPVDISSVILRGKKSIIQRQI